MTGTITAIQRISIGDGPGIRSTIFLKGCRFRCAWCHNPETWNPSSQIQHIPERCMACLSCTKVCPENALLPVNGKIEMDRNLCTSCGECTKVCPSGALSITGRTVSVEEVMEDVLRDKLYFIESGGGLTLSGGEPLTQSAFARGLLEYCRETGINTAIETTLDTDDIVLKALIPLVDLWMVDIKTMDDRKHLKYTGASNRPTLENLKILGSLTKNIIVRTPVVPGVNDDPDSIEAVCIYLKAIGIRRYELLPFHDLGFDKYVRHGIRNRMSGIKSLSRKDIKPLESIVARHGLNDSYERL